MAQVIKEKWFWITGFAHSQQQTNLWMKLPTIPPGLAGKIVKDCPLSEPTRLQDLEGKLIEKNKKKYFPVI